MKEYWFKEGLRFGCTQCGVCCVGEPGYVWLTLEEARKISEAVGVDFARFQRAYLRMVGERISLKERRNGECVIWKEGEGCLAYDDRPRQCRTFPFWKMNLEARDDWNREKDRCPGMGSGKLHTAGEIFKLAGLE